MHVLIIEDNPEIQCLLGTVMDHYSLAYSSVTTLADARQNLENTISEVIILDNALPDGYGIDFLDFLNEKYPRIEIILFTAHYIDINQRKINEKIRMYVQKPSLQPILAYLENIITGK